MGDGGWKIVSSKDFTPEFLERNPELAGVVGKITHRKYRNEPAISFDRVFESTLEAERAGELMILLKEGKIFNLYFQVPFVLQGGVKYVADFVYLDDKLDCVVEDTKGVWTRSSKDKVKQFEAAYRKKVNVIKRDRR